MQCSTAQHSTHSEVCTDLRMDTEGLPAWACSESSSAENSALSTLPLPSAAQQMRGGHGSGADGGRFSLRLGLGFCGPQHSVCQPKDAMAAKGGGKTARARQRKMPRGRAQPDQLAQLGHPAATHLCP